MTTGFTLNSDQLLHNKKYPYMNQHYFLIIQFKFNSIFNNSIFIHVFIYTGSSILFHVYSTSTQEFICIFYSIYPSHSALSAYSFHVYLHHVLCIPGPFVRVSGLAILSVVDVRILTLTLTYLEVVSVPTAQILFQLRHSG